jgi:hypothetical protein
MFAEPLEKFHAPIIPSRIFFPLRRVHKKRASNGCIFFWLRPNKRAKSRER